MIKNEKNGRIKFGMLCALASIQFFSNWLFLILIAVVWYREKNANILSSVINKSILT